MYVGLVLARWVSAVGEHCPGEGNRIYVLHDAEGLGSVLEGDDVRTMRRKVSYGRHRNS